LCYIYNSLGKKFSLDNVVVVVVVVVAVVVVVSDLLLVEVEVVVVIVVVDVVIVGTVQYNRKNAFKLSKSFRGPVAEWMVVETSSATRPPTLISSLPI